MPAPRRECRLRVLPWLTTSLILASVVLYFASRQFSMAGATARVGPALWASIGGGRVWLHNEAIPYRGSITHVGDEDGPPYVTGGDLPGFYLRILNPEPDASTGSWTVAWSPLYFVVVFTMLDLIVRIIILIRAPEPATRNLQT